MFLALSAGAIQAAEPAKISADIQVQLDPGTVLAAIPDDFIGFGYETSAVAREGFFSEKNARMVQLYRALSPGGLVRIGGIIGDHTRFEPTGKPEPHDMKDTTVINQAVITDLGTFLRATGWKAMWTLNLGLGSKEAAAQEALAIQKALGDRLQSFEIGNEVNALKRFNKDYPAYHAAFLDYKAAIRAALPNSIFSGPDSTSAGLDWVEKFAADEAQDTQLLITHYYRGAANSPKATIELLLTPDSNLDSKLAKLQEICRSKSLAYRINEVNSLVGGGKKDVSDTFASALWCLDFMFRAASHGSAGVNLETDVNQHGFISHYSPIFREEDGSLTARPEYYGMLAFATAGKGKVVKTTVGNTSVNLSAYATKAPDGSLWVTLLNRDMAQAGNIKIGLPPGYTKAEAYRLAAPSAQSKTDVTLADAQVASDGTWSPKTTEEFSVAGKAVSITVPATSAALVRLSSK